MTAAGWADGAVRRAQCESAGLGIGARSLWGVAEASSPDVQKRCRSRVAAAEVDSIYADFPATTAVTAL